MVESIRRKRDGHALSTEQIQGLIRDYTKGTIPDYQMSALAMAIVLRGMTPRETTDWTMAMLHSGRRVDLTSVSVPTVDKHSTGGVGDKISICLAPLVACCGAAVPMMSGRGLGHTGGTLDKLEAIAGFQVNLDVRTFRNQVKKMGCSLIGQTADLAPADRKLYALRDVTGTVESIPLITASILSKKLAEGIGALVMDVKVGRGAFMKTKDDAKELARSIVRVGKNAGLRVSALLTDMSQPLGRTIGNALETREALEVLHGEGPQDVRELTLVLGTEMLVVSRAFERRSDARRELERALSSGAALKKMMQITKAQGGDAGMVEQPDRLPMARKRLDVLAPRTGWVQSMDTEALGWCSVGLGAGRQRVQDVVDPSAGMEVHAKVGDRVKKGQPLLTLHGRSTKVVEQSMEAAMGCYRITSSPASASANVLPSLILGRVGR